MKKFSPRVQARRQRKHERIKKLLSEMMPERPMLVIDQTTADLLGLPRSDRRYSGKETALSSHHNEIDKQT